MIRSRQDRIKDLFQRALDLPAAAREVLLTTSRESPSVIEEVRGLIDADANAASFLQGPGSTEASTASELSPGELVGGRFRIVTLLGRGGMGSVYRAEDSVLSRHVALKFLDDSLSGNVPALERLRREARAAAVLNHPSICVIHEIGEDGGRPLIVMELLQGQTLRRRIESSPLQTDELLDWAEQIADALEVAHRNGVVHRDIKPANIFITSRGQAKILDFGLAKATRAPSSGGPAQDCQTAPGMVIGTAPYMSPEQARGEELDARTDLFSMGAVLYEMATGKLAFRGETPPRSTMQNWSA